jgi:hypothetical protein
MFVTLRNSISSKPPLVVRDRFTPDELVRYSRLGDDTLVALALAGPATAAAVVGLEMGEVVASLPAVAVAAYNLGKVVVNTAMSYWMEMNAYDRTTASE